MDTPDLLVGNCKSSRLSALEMVVFNGTCLQSPQCQGNAQILDPSGMTSGGHPWVSMGIIVIVSVIRGEVMSISR